MSALRRFLPGQRVIIRANSYKTSMTPLKKDQLREEERYMLGSGLRPHPNIYRSLLREGSFFSAFQYYLHRP